MSDITSDKEYYQTYYQRMGDKAYLGESVKNSSRMLVFCEWLRSYCKPGAKILDVGVGDAIFAELMPEFEWYGVDINTERAIHRLGRETTYDGNGQANGYEDRAVAHDLMKPPYPWPEKYFDAIICSEVLEHLWDLRVVHKEAKRLLKREGVYVISTPNFFWLQNLLEHHTRIMSQFEQHWSIEHIRHYGFDLHKRYLNEVGFVVDKHAGADSHYDPITANICRVIRDRLRETGTEIEETVLHKWCGEAIPHYSHTTIISCKKA